MGRAAGIPLPERLIPNPLNLHRLLLKRDAEGRPIRIAQIGAGTSELPAILRPHNEGGILPREGMVEVVSSVRRCFTEYGVATNPSGRYATLWRPYHFIGLEPGVSVASAALRREPTSCSESRRADVVAVARRPLKTGEVLDGEGGACVWG